MKRLGTLAVAFAILLVMAPASDASIIYTDANDRQIRPSGFGGSFAPWGPDVVTFEGLRSAAFNPNDLSGSSVYSLNAMVGGNLLGLHPLLLEAGDVIDGSLALPFAGFELARRGETRPPGGSPSTVFQQGPWIAAPHAVGYVGVKFFQVGTGPVFGWVRVDFNQSLASDPLDGPVVLPLSLTENILFGTVEEFAYESSGGPIVAGDTGLGPVPVPVPEPGTVGLLSLLAAGAALRARRRPAARS